MFNAELLVGSQARLNGQLGDLSLKTDDPVDQGEFAFEGCKVTTGRDCGLGCGPGRVVMLGHARSIPSFSERTLL
jgi:hypothetical protein